MVSLQLQPLSSVELLNLWERGQYLSPCERAELLLATAGHETSFGMIDQLTIGQRDCYLMRIREKILGPCFQAVAQCPVCNQQIDLSFNGSEIYTYGGEEHGTLLLDNFDGYEIQFHTPRCFDLRQIILKASSTDQQRQLFQNCLMGVRKDDQHINTDELPEEIKDQVVSSMAIADPLADVQLSLQCPSCKTVWEETFDIASFFWREIDSLARKLLRDIHVIASAYGWSEKDILDMNFRRREEFLELIGNEY